MNLNYLITYLNVIKLGSYSKAAKKLYFSQPNVSFQIKRLEEDIGLPLIDYHQKTIYPTKAGKMLLAFAEHVAREQSNLEHNLEQLREELVGNLFIAASYIPGEFILPAMLSDFNQLFPSVEIKAMLSDPRKVFTAVANGDFEIGFSSGKLENPALKYFKIAEDEVVLIVYPGHKLSHQKVASLADLTGESLIFRSEPEGGGYTPPDLLIEAGFDLNRCKTKLIIGSNIGVVTAVEAGAGIALLSNLVARKSEALGTVKVLKMEALASRREFFCIYKNSGKLSLACKTFIDFLRERLKIPPD
jgi:LysR family transcriptional regulator, transcriptional activator of the cysJI operon